MPSIMSAAPIPTKSIRIIRSNMLFDIRPAKAGPKKAAKTAPTVSARIPGNKGVSGSNEREWLRIAKDANSVMILTARFKGTACLAE